MADDITIRIGAELTEIKGALAGLRKDFSGLGNAIRQVGSGNNSITAIQGQLSGAATALKSLVGAFAAFQGARALQQAAAAGVEFNAALEDARLGIASLIAAQANLQDGQGKTVEGVDALNVALGLAEDQLFKLRVAGLETAATTQQLAEAFQSAVGAGIGAGLNLDEIRGLTVQVVQAAGALGVPMNQIAQEVRSILDGTIDINSRVALTLGITNEQVRNWKTQGTLVDELNKRLSTFTTAGAEAAKNFSVVTSNAQEAVQALAGDVFKGFFDELKKGIQDSTGGLFDTKQLAVTPELRDAVDLARELGTVVGGALADSLRGIVSLARDFSAFIKENREDINELVGSVGLLVSEFSKLVGEALSLVGAIGEAGVKTSAFSKVIQTIAIMIAGVRDGFRVIAAAVIEIGAAFIDVVLSPFEGWLRLIAEAVKLIDEEAGKAIENLANKMKALSTDADRLAADIIAPVANGTGAVAQVVKGLDQVIAKAKTAATEVRKVDQPNGAGAGGLNGLRNPPPKPKVDANQVLRAQIEQQLKELDQMYADGLVSLSAYYDRRGELQRQAIDAEIASEVEKQSKIAKNDEKAQNDAATKIALLQQKRLAADSDNARARLNAEKDVSKQIGELIAKDQDNLGNSAAAARIRLEETYRELLNKLGRDSEAAQLVQKLIDTGVARARFEDLKAQFDRMLADMERKRAAISESVRKGEISPAEGRQQDQAVVGQAANDMGRLNTEIQGVAESTGDPAIVENAMKIGDTLKGVAEEALPPWEKVKEELRSSLDEMSKNFERATANAGVDALTGLFTDLATGSKSAGDAIKDFAKGFIASMAQIAARALATFLVLQLLDAVFPGAGKMVAGAGGSASVFHRGGMVGGPSVRRRVNPLAFAAAPRFHDGGMVGLKPGEVPAILQTGEEVLARNDPRNAANGGGEQGGQGNGYRIVNVLDPALVSGYLESSAGERSVLNVISRNPGQVKQVIGA